MSKEREGSWWWYLRQVLLRPSGEFYTTGTFFTFVFAATWWRDNFASKEALEKWDLRRVIPQLHPAWWLVIGFVVILFLSIRASRKLWGIEHSHVVALSKSRILPSSAPEIAIDEDREASLGLPVSLHLQNVSKLDNIFRVEVQPLHFDEFFVMWEPSSIQVMQPGSIHVLRPRCIKAENGPLVELGYGIGEIGRVLYSKQANPNPNHYPFMTFSITCEDKMNNRYVISCEIEYVAAENVVRFGHIFPKLI
ncbi:MAG: hypothetical protein ABSB30_12915 [Terracidiphilus sp.]|jgi:hypothetical protein